MEGRFEGAYGDGTQLFWHLISNGSNNERFTHCSDRQRRAVADLVAHLINTKAAQIQADGAVEEAMRASEI